MVLSAVLWDLAMVSWCYCCDYVGIKLDNNTAISTG